jgi:hypothetical protein
LVTFPNSVQHVLKVDVFDSDAGTILNGFDVRISPSPSFFIIDILLIKQSIFQLLVLLLLQIDLHF